MSEASRLPINLVLTLLISSSIRMRKSPTARKAPWTRGKYSGAPPPPPAARIIIPEVFRRLLRVGVIAAWVLEDPEANPPCLGLVSAFPRIQSLTKAAIANMSSGNQGFVQNPSHLLCRMLSFSFSSYFLWESRNFLDFR